MRYGFRTNSKFLVLIFALTCYILFFSFLSVQMNRHYLTSLDYAIFVQSIWSTINQGTFFYSSIIGMSQFGIHNSPILIVLIPVLMIFKNPEVLLIFQTVLLALGAVPLYLIAREKINESVGIIIGCIYLLYPPLHGVNLYDFHEVAFVPLLLGFCFYFLLKRNYYCFFILSLITMTIKEDVAFCIVLIGFYALLTIKDASREDKILFLLVSIIGLIWLALTFIVIIPHFNIIQHQSTLIHYEDPLQSITMFWNEKVEYFFRIFLPIGFIPFFSPGILAISIPFFAEIFFSSLGMRTNFLSHSATLIIPLVFITTISGIVWINKKIGKKYPEIIQYILFLIIVLTIISNITSPVPQLFSQINDKPNLHYNNLNTLIEKIPQNLSISSQTDILPHIATRNEVYGKFTDNVDLVLIDTTTIYSSILLEEKEKFTDYSVVYNDDGIILLMAPSSNKRINSELF